MTDFFHKSFKKIWISNKPKRKSKIGEFMERRQKLKKKSVLSVISEKEEEEIRNLELMIAEACEEENRKKIVDNFKDMDGNNGNLNHQGVWKAKRKYVPKIKPSIQVGKKLEK